MRVVGPERRVPATGREPSGSAAHESPTTRDPSQTPAAEPEELSSRHAVYAPRPLAGAHQARNPGRVAGVARRGIVRNVRLAAWGSLTAALWLLIVCAPATLSQESERKLPVRPALVRRQQSEAALPQQHKTPLPKVRASWPVPPRMATMGSVV